MELNGDSFMRWIFKRDKRAKECIDEHSFLVVKRVKQGMPDQED